MGKLDKIMIISSYDAGYGIGILKDGIELNPNNEDYKEIYDIIDDYRPYTEKETQEKFYKLYPDYTIVYIEDATTTFIWETLEKKGGNKWQQLK